MGVDLGSKRIGVAISDSTGTVATPIEVVKRRGNRNQEHQRLDALATEWAAEIIVVGIPYNLDGSRGRAAKNYLREAKALARNTELDVVTHDERLTTVSAERSLSKQTLIGAARRQVVDKVAAAVMLQSWLDAGPSRA